VVQNSYDVNSRACQQVHADSGTFPFFYITADRATLPESIQLLAEAAAGGPISQTPCTRGGLHSHRDRHRPGGYPGQAHHLPLQQPEPPHPADGCPGGRWPPTSGRRARTCSSELLRTTGGELEQSVG